MVRLGSSQTEFTSVTGSDTTQTCARPSEVRSADRLLQVYAREDALPVCTQACTQEGCMLRDGSSEGGKRTHTAWPSQNPANSRVKPLGGGMVGSGQAYKMLRGSTILACRYHGDVLGSKQTSLLQAFSCALRFQVWEREQIALQGFLHGPWHRHTRSGETAASFTHLFKESNLSSFPVLRTRRRRYPDRRAPHRATQRVTITCMGGEDMN